MVVGPTLRFSGGAEQREGYTPRWWQPSGREYPRVLSTPEYPGHYMVRLVGSAGTIGFRNRQLFLSRALEDEYVRLEESGDGVWSVHFRNVLPGKFSERDFRILP